MTHDDAAARAARGPPARARERPLPRRQLQRGGQRVHGAESVSLCAHIAAKQCDHVFRSKKYDIQLPTSRRVMAASSPFEATDTYTQYELLAPGSAQFRVTYFVTERTCAATEPSRAVRPLTADLSHLCCCCALGRREGATLHLNGTRPGSEQTDLSAEDLYSSAPISATLVSGPSLIAEDAGDQVGNGNASDPDSMFSRRRVGRLASTGAGRGRRHAKTYSCTVVIYICILQSTIFYSTLLDSQRGRTRKTLCMGMVGFPTHGFPAGFRPEAPHMGKN